MKNYKITISYDGTGYHGWQRQPDKKTIQGTIEKALHPFRSEKIHVAGAGRTDAGVHALGQTAHFKADLDLSENELLRALNGRLPRSIRIISVETADMDFHARKSARSKIYRYRIYNAYDISPFDIRYVLHWPSSLNFKKMQQAASLFVREADFSSFSSNRFLNPVRKVMTSHLERQGREIVYTVQADGFLRYMARTMAGALLAAGRGKMEPENIENLFQNNQRSSLVPTAPPHGLALVKVIY
ncbi:MAG: tRNA pseudouridine(38-40) synthase TruA [Candidatus Aminicenantaceae bacterium]